jgi:SAM-dependent methyltransferase
MPVVRISAASVSERWQALGVGPQRYPNDDASRRASSLRPSASEAVAGCCESARRAKRAAAGAGGGRLRAEGASASLAEALAKAGAPAQKTEMKGPDDLERERAEADRRYHDLFAALDRVVGEGVDAAAATERLATFQSLLIQFLQQITPYIDSKLRIVEQRVADAAMTATLAHRASQRIAPAPSAPRAPSAPASSAPRAPSARSAPDEYVAFEDCFRGSESEIRARQADYVQLFSGAIDVVDAGCGRGEFLSLLKEAGISARGIDLNAEMVEVCRARGLTADHADAVTYLEGLPDGSVGGLFAAQVVEHLPPDQLLAFLRAAGRVLRPGARIVLETINPSCWVAFFDSFLRDLTHTRPLHPDTLKFLVVASGFTEADIRYRTPVPEADRLRRVARLAEPASSAPPDARRLAELVAAFNLNMERLNDRLFTHLDYAVVARRL